MTKRRLWWSELWQQAAALGCGLLLLVAQPVEAVTDKISASTASSAKNKALASQKMLPAASKAAKKSAQSPAKKAGRTAATGPYSAHLKRPGKVAANLKSTQKRGRPLPEEIGSADIIASETKGLRGSASFYSQKFQGRRTSSGERFRSAEFTAASNHFPLGSKVAVRRLDSDRCAIVKVNDRMNARHVRRIIDVSRSVAEYLGMVRAGVVMVKVAPYQAGYAGDACQAAFEAEPVCAECQAVPRFPGFSTDLSLPAAE